MRFVAMRGMFVLRRTRSQPVAAQHKALASSTHLKQDGHERRCPYFPTQCSGNIPAFSSIYSVDDARPPRSQLRPRYLNASMVFVRPDYERQIGLLSVFCAPTSWMLVFVPYFGN